MLPDAVARVLDACAQRQQRTGHLCPPAKQAVKRDAARIVSQVAKPGDVALDVGGDDWYAPYFEKIGVTTRRLNLPDDDMHRMEFEVEFDGAICMHVLEHSLFPLLVMELMRRAVRPGGWIYIVVPHPRPSWKAESKPHVTVMPVGAWGRLIEIVGLEVIHRSSGAYNPRPGDIEERFLCRRGLT